MNTKKITESEIAEYKISALPTRPTAPTAFGGKGYTAQQMKAAFDKLPLYVMERLNSLIDDIADEGEGGAAASIPTGIRDGHSLRDLFYDIVSGALAEYLTVGDSSLAERLSEIEARLARVEVTDA